MYQVIALNPLNSHSGRRKLYATKARITPFHTEEHSNKYRQKIEVFERRHLTRHFVTDADRAGPSMPRCGLLQTNITFRI